MELVRHTHTLGIATDEGLKVERFALINAQQISSESLHVYMSAGKNDYMCTVLV